MQHFLPQSTREPTGNKPAVMKLTLSKTESSIPHSKNFPLELVNGVLKYCQPNELFAVALANSDYRSEAERVLYRSIALNCYTAKASLRTAPCLSTLSKIQSKADMVISFELIYMGSDLPPSVLDQLCGSLVAMRSLKHLKLNFSPYQYQDVILPLLIPVLKSCTFSLANLYIPSVMLGGWIFGQNKLKVLGMLDYAFSPGVVLQDPQISICKQLSTQNSSPPTIFLIAPFGLLLDRMIAFPVFSVNAQWNAKDVADSIPWTNAHSIIYFKLFLDNLSEEGTVHDVLTSLAENFLYLEKIGLIVNDPRMHLRPSSFSSLHKFPHLESFCIEYYSGSDKLTHAENHLDLASSWATNCPNLHEINFPDGRTARHDESGHWV